MRTCAAKRKGQALHEIIKKEGRAIVEGEEARGGEGGGRLVVTVVLGWREYVLLLSLLLLMLLICLRMVA